MKVHVPPIKTQGIKTKLVPFIQENVLVDDKTTWIEPFMGSGVVGLDLAPQHAIFADTNIHIINFYNAVKNSSITPETTREFLEHQGQLLQEGDDTYYKEVRNRFNQKHDSMDFLSPNRSCYNGLMRFNRKHELNTPYGHKPMRFSKAYITKIVNQIAFVQERIQQNDWTFAAQSFGKTIREAPADSFIYCDPPYLGRNVTHYDDYCEEQDILLHQLLMKHDGRFMVSSWDHDEYRHDEYLNTIWNDCYKVTTEHTYFVGAKENNRNSTVEALLMNYEPMNS